jgi:prepilin-type processing-associated H-X9-DG protein
MHCIVVAPVFELLAYARANFKNVIWCDGHVAMIE